MGKAVDDLGDDDLLEFLRSPRRYIAGEGFKVTEQQLEEIDRGELARPAMALSEAEALREQEEVGPDLPLPRPADVGRTPGQVMSYPPGFISPRHEANVRRIEETRDRLAELQDMERQPGFRDKVESLFPGEPWKADRYMRSIAEARRSAEEDLEALKERFMKPESG